MNEKNVFNNKNGNLTIDEWVMLIHTGDIDKYRRKMNLVTDKCPPIELIDSHQSCFRCQDCMFFCLDKVKDYKKHYKIGKYKIMKSDLDGRIKEELNDKNN